MSVAVRGRVPSVWGEQTAAHITERLQALERDTRGIDPGFLSPAIPAFGPGAVIGGGGSTVTPGGGGGTTTIVQTTETVEDPAAYSRAFLLMGA